MIASMDPGITLSSFGAGCLPAPPVDVGALGFDPDGAFALEEEALSAASREGAGSIAFTGQTLTQTAWLSHVSASITY